MNQTEEQKQFEEGLADFEMQDSENGEPKALIDLSWVARRIRLIENEVEKVVQFEKAESEKIQSCCLQQLLKMQSRIDQLSVLARNVLVADGGYGRDKGQAKFYALPGIGRFSFGSTRESVEDDAYKKLSAEDRNKIHETYPQLFTKTVSIRPDKENIKAAISGLAGGELAGFTIKQKTETFKFRAE